MAGNPGGHSVGYVNISTVIGISKCDHDSPKVNVRITMLNHPSKSIKFEMLKAELSAQRSALVNDRETTNIGVTKEFFLDNNAFNINISSKTVQPIHNDALKMVEEIEPKQKKQKLNDVSLSEKNANFGKYRNFSVPVLFRYFPEKYRPNLLAGL
uniref:Uncharacterized protein n=1 Tax=Globodera pallida TaxID=36090 RepID=A0A183C869_GLOPA